MNLEILEIQSFWFSFEPGNTGKQSSLITSDPGNTGTQAILITSDPGNTGTQAILITSDPGNTGTQAILITLGVWTYTLLCLNLYFVVSELILCYNLGNNVKTNTFPKMAPQAKPLRSRVPRRISV